MNINNKKENMIEIFEETRRKFADKEIFFERKNNRWVGITMGQHAAHVKNMAYLFKTAGLRHGDHLAIVASNSYMWQVVEHAALIYGLTFFALEPHASSKHIKNTLGHFELKALFLDDQKQMKSFLGHLKLAENALVMTMGEAQNNLQQNKVDLSRPFYAGDLFSSSTTIFTSGTTGVPKSLTYHQDQLAKTISHVLETFNDINESDRTLCWLPLANLFQRNLNLMAMVKGLPIYISSDPKKVMDDLRDVRPTIIIAVPRFLEKVYKQAQSIKRIFPPALQFFLSPLIDKIVKRKLGGKIRFIISGSAKCSIEILNFFFSIKTPVLEAYGLSESIIPVALNNPAHYKVGSVGKVLNCNSVRISKEGEIFIKSPGISQDLKAQLNDGYMSTGDLGHLDEEGYLFIKGRANDIVKTSTGRKLDLNKLDQAFTNTPHVDQVVTLAENLPFACLVVSHQKPLTLAEKRDIRTYVNLINSGLSSYEKIRSIITADEVFSIDHGTITNNLKIKRQYIAKRYQNKLDQAVSSSKSFVDFV